MPRRRRRPLLPAVFSVGALPMAGSNDMFSTLRQFEAVWRSTIHHLDGMRTGPLAFPLSLRLSLDALREHASNILLSVQAFQRRGGAPGDTAGDVPNVRVIVDRFLQELLKTKQMWNAFVSGTNDVMLGEVSGSGFGADTPFENEKEVLDTTKPQTIPESLMLLVGGMVVIGAIWMLRK